MTHPSYLCPRTPHFLEIPFLVPGCSGIFLNLCRVNLHDRCRGILNGLYVCLRIFLCSPSLEFSKQGLVLTLYIFDLTLMSGFKCSSYFVAGGTVLCGRHQIFSDVPRLRCWPRLIGNRLKR